MPTDSTSTDASSAPAPVTGTETVKGGRRRSGVPVKTLKKMLKKAGLKTTGRKAALTRRAKKAHLKMKGGDDEEEVVVDDATQGGRRRKSRKSKGFRLY
jgi:hypothetical protein